VEKGSAEEEKEADGRTGAADGVERIKHFQVL
jgi:hypothetical protein